MATAAAALSIAEDNKPEKGAPLIKFSTFISFIAVHAYLLIGAAIWMKLENSISRRKPEDDPDAIGPLGQPYLDFLTSYYFMIVTTSTIGYGDHVCTNNNSRAFLFVWGGVGIGLVGTLIVSVVQQLSEGISFRLRKMYKHMLRRNRAEGMHKTGEVKPSTDQERLEEKIAVEEVRTKALLVEVSVAILFYTAWLLIGAAVWTDLEVVKYEDGPDGEQVVKWAGLGNLNNAVHDYTGNSFGNFMFYWWYSSATIGYGTDFTPKSDAGKIFFIFWIQPGFLMHAFIFSNLMAAVVRHSNKRLIKMRKKVTRSLTGNSI